ncbi:MAG: hypothetical protein PHT58_02110 [Eubacteriales bacterium]|nr:hypothetical protein [Eubacteriales bacterium]
MIELNVTKAKMNAAAYEMLTSGMANAVSVHFTFSSDWDNLSKTAVFSNGAETIAVMENAWNGTDSCIVPHEVLEKPYRTIVVGLVGTSGSSVILPTVWCSIGRVRLGASAQGDSSTNAALPVWAQMENKISGLETTSYTSLEKNPSGGSSGYPVRVLLHGLTSADAGAHLYVYSVLRNRQRKTCWRHPSNYCVADEGGGRLGYGQIAGFTYGGNAEYNYSAVPEWMPNDGYLETEFTLTKAVIERGYYDVDISTWLLPLVKPKAFGDNGLMSWDEIGIIGLSQYGQNSPLLFRFNIERGGSVVGESHDTLCIGLRGSLPDTSDWFDSRDGSIRTNHMYVSIR